MGVLAAIALAAAVTMLTTIGHDLLPPLYLNRADVNLHQLLSGSMLVVIALFIVAMVMLFRQRKSVLDMWLLVACRPGWSRRC